MLTMMLIIPIVAIDKPLCPPVNSLFLDALEMVESGGNCNAVGDGGLAVGCLQIHEIYRKEANRIAHAPVFGSADRFDREASIEMARIVLTHHGRRYAKKGFKIGYPELASLHRIQYGWKPSNLTEETKRTEKLLAYMKEHAHETVIGK